MAQLETDIAQRLCNFLPRLRRFAYALTGSLADADDLCQEACLRALGKIEQFRSGTQFESWMFRIARNVWIDKVRQERYRGEHTDISTLNIEGSDGRHIVEVNSDLVAVSRGLRTLSEDQQLIVALVCVDGQSYQSASDILGIPVGTVMSRLARARKKLNALLTDPGAGSNMEQSSEARDGKT